MSPGKMAVYCSFAAWVGFMGGALALLGGCSGAEKKNDFFDSTEPNNPEPVGPCVSQGCNSDEKSFATESSCTTTGRTCRSLVTGCGNKIWCGAFAPRCTALPVCEADDEEVTTCPKGATCYSKTVCGSTILCQKPFANCDAYPACDTGDGQAKDEATCKAIGACYSRTLCGTTIWCVDKN